MTEIQKKSVSSILRPRKTKSTNLKNIKRKNNRRQINKTKKNIYKNS